MIILNFSHRLTRENRAQIRSLTGRRITRLIDIPVHFDDRLPYIPQLQALMEQIPLSKEKLMSGTLLINPPGLNFIAALVMAYLHALRGHFPAILRLRKMAGSLDQYEVAEILYLQDIRDQIRLERFKADTEET